MTIPPIPHARIGSIVGLLETLNDNGGKMDVYKLSQQLHFELDDLMPITEAAELLGFVKIESGDSGDRMKATVIVTLKPTVLDPQGMTIQRSVQSMGLADVVDIRQGKYFDIRLGEGVSAERGAEMVQKLAEDVLTNPVIEEYRIVWEQK